MAAVKVTVTDKDSGWNEMIRGAKQLTRQPYIKVGVMGEKSHGAGLTNVDIATFHEFGTERIPQRSFVRATVDANLKEIEAKQDKILDAVLFDGAIFKDEAGKLGLEVQAKMQKRIKDRIPPPLAQSTVEKKGSTVPLVDTGQLLRSITFEQGFDE